MRSIVTIITVLVSLTIFSCGGGSGDSAFVGESGNGVSHYQLSVSNSIGIELGDSNYVFGQVQDAVPLSSGGVAILDANALKIRLFGSDGGFISTIGRQGNGPGEFAMPRGMALLDNGDLIVSDMGGGALEIFSDSLEWKGEITGFFPRPPQRLISAGDSSFTGILRSFDRDEGLMGYSIARIESQSEPAVIYLEDMYPFDPSMIGPTSEDRMPLFTSDDSGRVFISEPSTDQVQVVGYTPGGEIFLEISTFVDKKEKSEEQLAREEAEFQEFSSRMGSRGGRMSGVELQFDPELYRNAVTGLGVDSQSRLWVRLGTYEYPFWNVYDMNGELLCTASLMIDDPDIDFFIVRIEDEGAVAWVEDPTTWPRVFIVELP